MFFRPSFLLLSSLVLLIAFSSGKSYNASAKPGTAQTGQSFVINNNCGPSSIEREMMVYIKDKVDYIAARSASKESPCTTGWVLHGKSCYLVIDIPTPECNDAQRTCQRLGGDLAKITAATENQFISNLLAMQPKITFYGAWLGLHRKANTKFYWADHTPLANYTAWNTGEPSSIAERCSQMYAAGPSKGKWNDLSCTVAKNKAPGAPVVLCQKNFN